MNFARDLINEPSNRLTPRMLAAKAEAMAKEVGLGIEILDERKDLRAEDGRVDRRRAGQRRAAPRDRRSLHAGKCQARRSGTRIRRQRP